MRPLTNIPFRKITEMKPLAVLMLLVLLPYRAYSWEFLPQLLPMQGAAAPAPVTASPPLQQPAMMGAVAGPGPGMRGAGMGPRAKGAGGMMGGGMMGMGGAGKGPGGAMMGAGAGAGGMKGMRGMGAGGDAGGGTSPMMVWMQLLARHAEITRAWQPTAAGIASTTTAADPALARLIQTHVEQMRGLLEGCAKGGGGCARVRGFDPLFAAVFDNAKDITLKVRQGLSDSHLGGWVRACVVSHTYSLQLPHLAPITPPPKKKNPRPNQGHQHLLQRPAHRRPRRGDRSHRVCDAAGARPRGGRVGFRDEGARRRQRGAPGALTKPAVDLRACIFLAPASPFPLRCLHVASQIVITIFDNITRVNTDNLSL
jgi:hypothetical protein